MLINTCRLYTYYSYETQLRSRNKTNIKYSAVSVPDILKYGRVMLWSI